MCKDFICLLCLFLGSLSTVCLFCHIVMFAFVYLYIIFHYLLDTFLFAKDRQNGMVSRQVRRWEKTGASREGRHDQDML